MDKMKKPGKRKIIKLLIFFILLSLLIFGLWLYDTVRNDPNYLIKKSSSVLYELHEDQPKKVSFTYKSSGLLGKMSSELRLVLLTVCLAVWISFIMRFQSFWLGM